MTSPPVGLAPFKKKPSAKPVCHHKGKGGGEKKKQKTEEKKNLHGGARFPNKETLCKNDLWGGSSGQADEVPVNEEKKSGPIEFSKKKVHKAVVSDPKKKKKDSQGRQGETTGGGKEMY